jgi:hypothetical protein
MRTKACRKLGESECTEVLPIRVIRHPAALIGRVEICGHSMFPSDVRELARKDGFDLVVDFYQFFLPNGGIFDGQLIKWGELE